MTKFLPDVLKLAARGWSIIPIRNARQCGKRPPPRFKWTPFQTRRPTDAELREWFDPASILKPTGLAVVHGPVSGDLVCRDFDHADAYRRWKQANPDLASMLPTVQTARGFHVYFRCPGAVFRNLADGELRAGAGHYTVLPPSIHPTGAVYEWIGALTDEEPPIIDPVRAMLVPNETEQSEQIEQSEAMRRSPPLDSNNHISAEVLARLREPIELAMRRSLPDGEGKRNRAVFVLVRALKGIPELRSASAKSLYPVVLEWHKRAHTMIGTKDFLWTYTDFVVGVRRVRVPMGEGPMDKALERVNRSPAPLVAERYGCPNMTRLISLCRELQREHHPAPFYLSCRTVEKILGIDHATASRWFLVLVTDEVLRIHTRGKPSASGGRATRYWYCGGE